MKIALIGYGKMGQAIEEVALQREHQVVLKINEDNLAEFTNENMKEADIAIEFTGPDSAVANITKLLEMNCAVVCGSTGWTGQINEVEKIVKEKNGSFIYASNFSVGVNIFFELNKKLASLMDKHEEYDIVVEETHHTQKKDAPSGTAITLAEQVIEKIKRKSKWINALSDKPEEVHILSYRIDPAPGTHIVKYTSAIDDIEIIHTAHNRKGFALGAVLAAEFLKDRKGIYGMKEVLGF